MPTKIVRQDRPHGYVCKRCGDVAPYGVGYVSDEPAAVQRSRTTERCACGHSVRSTTPTTEGNRS